MNLLGGYIFCLTCTPCLDDDFRFRTGVVNSIWNKVLEYTWQLCRISFDDQWIAHRQIKRQILFGVFEIHWIHHYQFVEHLCDRYWSELEFGLAWFHSREFHDVRNNSFHLFGTADNICQIGIALFECEVILCIDHELGITSDGGDRSTKVVRYVA